MLAERWTDETELWGYKDYPSHYKYLIIHNSVGDWLSSQSNAGVLYRALGNQLPRWPEGTENLTSVYVGCFNLGAQSGVALPSYSKSAHIDVLANQNAVVRWLQSSWIIHFPFESLVLLFGLKHWLKLVSKFWLSPWLEASQEDMKLTAPAISIQ